MALRERKNRVYKSLNKPLLILGVERKLFIGGLVLSATMYHASTSFFVGVVTMVVCWFAGRYVTSRDPIMFTVLRNSSNFKRIYDAAKYEPPHVEIR